jgi:hypothetical protein
MTRRSLSVLLLVVVVVGCGGSDGAKGPTATVGAERTTESTTTTTAKALTPEQEVEAAYLKSWDVYAKAKLKLTTDGLDCCFAGEQLARTKAEIESRIQQAKPARVRVDHDYTIRLLATDTAVVVDNYRNHSVFIDANTGQPVEPDPNEANSDTSTLRKLDGEWKVTQISANSAGS